MLSEIKLVMDEGISKDAPAVIFLTGGFGLNQYIFTELSKEYKKPGTIFIRPTDNWAAECFPVSRGGLLRYNSISPGNLPSQYGYALVRDEVFNYHVHPDGIEKIRMLPRRMNIRDANGQSTGGTEIVLRPVCEAKKGVVFSSTYNEKEGVVFSSTYNEKEGVVFSSTYNEKDNVVFDRLFVIIDKGARITANEPVTKDAFAVYWLPQSEWMLDATIVYFDKAGVKTHDAWGRLGRNTTKFGHGIYHLKSIKKRVHEDFLRKHNVPLVKDNNGVPTYKVTCRVIMKYQGEHEMTIGWEVKTKVGNKCKFITLWEDDEKMWDANFSSFVEEVKAARVTGEDDGEGSEEGEDEEDGCGYD